MRVLPSVSAVFVLLGAMSAQAAAQWGYASYNACTGSLCAATSVEVTTFWDGMATQVTLRMRNGSGTGGTNGFLINGFGVWGPGLDAADLSAWSSSVSYPSYTTSGSVQQVGQAQMQWQWDQPGWFGSMAGLNAGLGVMGCDTERWLDVLGGEAWWGGLATCSPGSWLTFSFSTSFEWSASDSDWQVWFTTQSDPTGNSGHNIVSMDCRGDSCLTTVPEPVTVLLLGTGLAGIGAMRARRRKKDESA